MSDVPTGKVIKPYDWLEDDQGDEATEVMAYDPEIAPLPEHVDPIAVRQADLVESQWSGFVTSQLPDLTADYDRTGFGMGKPKPSRRRGPPRSPITPRSE